MNSKQFYEYIVPEDRRSTFTRKWTKRYFSKAVRTLKGKYTISYDKYGDLRITGDINGYEVTFTLSKLTPNARYTGLPKAIQPSKVISSSGERMLILTKYSRGEWLYIKQSDKQHLEAIPTPKHTVALLHAYKDLEILELSKKAAVRALMKLDKKVLKSLSGLFFKTALYLCLKDIGFGIKKGHIIDMASNYLHAPIFTIKNDLYEKSYPFRYYTVDLNKPIPKPEGQKCAKRGHSCPKGCYTDCEAKTLNKVDEQDYKKLLKLQKLIT